MPWIERLRNGLVYDIIRQALLYRQRFNASQTSVISLCLLASAVAGALSWLHFCGLIAFYVAAVYFTTKRCATELLRGKLYRSELILRLYEGVKDGVVSVFSLFDGEHRTGHDVHVTETGHQSTLQGVNQSADQSVQSHISSSEEQNGRNENTANDEIERFLNLIMRDFVQSWYKTLSPDPDVLEDIHEILYQAAVQVSKSRLAKLNIKKVASDVVKLYHHHLAAVFVCKSAVKSRPKRRRSSSAWIESVEDAFKQKYGFHAALANETSEINYVRSLVDVVLVRLLPIRIHRCRIARALVTEILACNVVLPLLDKMSTPEWIHEAVTTVFSNNSDLLTMELDGHSAKAENEVSCPDDSIIPTNSVDINNLIYDHRDGTDTVREKKVNFTQKELKEDVRNDSKEKHITLEPHAEITIGNTVKSVNSFSLKRHSIIGAACVAEVAGEAFESEQRQPPSGKATSCSFVEKDVHKSTDGLTDSGNDTSDTQTNQHITELPSPSKRAPLIREAKIDTDECDDISEFKEANSGLTYPRECVNGFTESGETFEDARENNNTYVASIPLTMVGPSIKSKFPFTPTHRSSVHILGHSTCPVDITNRRSSSAEVMSRSTSSFDIASQCSSSADLLSRSSSSADIPSHVREAVIGERINSNSSVLSVSPPAVKSGKEFLIPYKSSVDSLPDSYTRETPLLSPSSGGFFLSEQIEDAEDVTSDSDTSFYEPPQKWAQLASNIPNSSGYESALANCVADSKPDEYKVLENKELLFHSVTIPSTDTMTDRGSSSYTVYKIEFEAWYWSEGEVVLRRGTVMRRFREFINLQARLENNASYKLCLKDVKGPKRWMSLPFGNMDKGAVEGRRKYLEKFLVALLEKKAVCNGEEMKEFLAYEGKSHIAFVGKPTELPRIDKMLARTVSGMFGRIATVLPSLPPDVLPSLSRKESSVMQKSAEEEPGTDEDDIELSLGVVHDENRHLLMYEKFSEDYIQRIQQDEMPTHPIIDQSTEPERHFGIEDWENKAIEQVPLRSDGDGCATPDPPSSQSLDERCYSEIPLARAVLDFGARALSSQSTWVCREGVLSVVQILLGRALDRWLEEQVTILSSSEQCCVYLEMLRDTIWPKGKLSSEEPEVLSDEQKAYKKQQACKALKEFFPKVLVAAIGDEHMDEGITQVIASVENQKLNRHVLFTLIDLILERLFPELTNQVTVPPRS